MYYFDHFPHFLISIFFISHFIDRYTVLVGKISFRSFVLNFPYFYYVFCILSKLFYQFFYLNLALFIKKVSYHLNIILKIYYYYLMMSISILKPLDMINFINIYIPLIVSSFSLDFSDNYHVISACKVF